MEVPFAKTLGPSPFSGESPMHGPLCEDSDETVSVSDEESQDGREERWKSLAKVSSEQQESWDELAHRYGKAKRMLRKGKTSASSASSNKELKAMEVFCGCAELSVQLNLQGINAVGVDAAFNKDKPRSACINVDLTMPEGQTFFWKMVEDIKPDYIHFAPPCGTASRARERRISPLAGSSMKVPQPLRTDEFPDGLPGLSENDQARVQAANRLYAFVAEVVRHLAKIGVHWTIENPANSLFWKTSWLSHLERNVPMKAIVFQHCMHGGTRDKRTMLWHDARLDLVTEFSYLTPPSGIKN